MKIELHLENGENGSPIELANALIRTLTNDANDEEMLKQRQKELGEVAEHIQTYLKFNGGVYYGNYKR